MKKSPCQPARKRKGHEFAKNRKIWNLVCEDPYRLFFPLGILMGSLGISHWLIYALGWVNSYSGFFHSSIQIKAYMTSFAIGFLTTSMPRFASAPHANTSEVLTFLALILGVLTFSSFGHWIISETCFIALLLALGIFAVRRFMRRRSISSPPLEFVWVPVAILNGVLGSAILILGQLKLAPAGLALFGKLMAEQGFILSIVLGVGGFLAPRLMGHFEPPGPSEASPMERLKLRRRRIKIHLSLAILFTLSFWIEGLGHRTLGFSLRTLIVTGVIFWNRAWPRPPRTSDMYVWLLWGSMGMVVLGHWAACLSPKYRVEMLHLIFLGGLSLMTFAVGTMVVMGHAGESEKLRKPLWILWLVLAGLALALGGRVAAGLFPKIYFKLLGIASACWLLAAASWLFFIIPRILKIPTLDEFEKFHEEAKARVRQFTPTPNPDQAGRKL